MKNALRRIAVNALVSCVYQLLTMAHIQDRIFNLRPLPFYVGVMFFSAPSRVLNVGSMFFGFTRNVDVSSDARVHICHPPALIQAQSSLQLSEEKDSAANRTRCILQVKERIAKVDGVV